MKSQRILAIDGVLIKDEDLSKFNGVPFKDRDGSRIGTTTNARSEGGYVVVDIVLGTPVEPDLPAIVEAG